MKQNPKISIVTPSYNLGKYIRRAIDSVLTQNYDNFEFFVIDGGSTDETIEILSEYDDKLKWISEPDEGQTDAINKGLNLSTGDIFAWLNADDYYEGGAFEKVTEVFKRHPEVGVIYGNCFMVSPTYKKLELKKPPETITLRRMLDYGNHIYGPASFYNLKLVKEVGGFDTQIEYWMDYDMFLKLRKISEFYYLDENLANFMLRSNQKTPKKGNENRKKYLKEAYTISIKEGGSKYSPLYFAKYPKIIRIAYNILWHLLYE
jgi:glycosyltransferase involved in cell wall biosynthesis